MRMRRLKLPSGPGWDGHRTRLCSRCVPPFFLPFSLPPSEIERRRTIDRHRDWYKSCAVIHGPKEKKNNEVSVWLCEGSTLHHLQTSEFWGACFREPTSLPFRTSLFWWTWMHVAGRSGCSMGKAKKSSHPWHVRCWSLRRNELECTDLVHWTEALLRFSSRDAIFVVGSVLEKHFDGDFTPEQEKDITKRWPPGYQSWKLGLALNGLNVVEKQNCSAGVTSVRDLKSLSPFLCNWQGICILSNCPDCSLNHN